MEQRQIKFRVFNGEQMVSPDYIDREGYAHWKENSILHSSNELLQFTRLHDKYGKEIYADYLLSDGEIVFRVYDVPGGFVIKSRYWAKDISDLVSTDALIYESLSDAQVRLWIENSCEIVGSIYE